MPSLISPIVSLIRAGIGTLVLDQVAERSQGQFPHASLNGCVTHDYIAFPGISPSETTDFQVGRSGGQGQSELLERVPGGRLLPCLQSSLQAA